MPPFLSSILIFSTFVTPLAFSFNDSNKFFQRLGGIINNSPKDEKKREAVSFTFNAFGDSGWSRSHQRKSSANSSFKRHYIKMDPRLSLIGDLNYINWETSVGRSCDLFWSPPSPSHYAFLTHPQELRDAAGLGFNVIGLANNHSYDCLRSNEGNGPLQTFGHIQNIKKQHDSKGNSILFSGVFSDRKSAVSVGSFRTPNGEVPVTFLSAYVGGNSTHCKYISCTAYLDKYAAEFKRKKGLRVLALHSWNKSSHQELKIILDRWLKMNLVDIAIGSGPHVAEKVYLLKTPYGEKVKATSLGNFIHPGLGYQPNNIVLKTQWTYDPSSQGLALNKLSARRVSCNGESCSMKEEKVYK